jgi:RNA polymerase sigma-70 factor (sigma-E family)
MSMTAAAARATIAAMGARDVEFEAYVAARRRGLLRTAYLLTGDQHSAEDLLQSALAKLYLSWDKVQRREALDGYVRRIMVNEHISWWRRAWRRNEHSTGDMPETGYDDPGHASDAVARDALWQVVLALPPRQRAAVVLRFYEDMSEADTAQVLGCSVGTVKSQVSRALSTLRASMTIERGASR